MAKFVKIIAAAAFFAFALTGAYAQDKPAASNAAAGSDAAAEETDETKLLLDDGGAATADNARNNQRTGAFTIWDFLRMILILAAVVAAIYLLFRILKKRTSPKLQDADLFKVLSTQVLANNRSLHLVEVGRQVFLVGVSENAVNLISEIDDKETLDEIRLKADQYKEASPTTFRERLAGFFKPISGGTGAGSTGTGGAPLGTTGVPTEFFKKQRERLKKF